MEPGYLSCKVKAEQETGMAGNFRSETNREGEIVSDEEVLESICYLDPDRELRRSDVVLGISWILLVVLLAVFIFILHH
jgi:hypothetical protein